MGTCIWLLQLISLFVVSYSYNNGIGRKPAMGWNTWCSVGVCETDICNEDMILEASQAMISNGMQKLGYNHINLDDCWTACERGPNGTIQADPKRFPNGIKSLTQTLHAMDFKFGLYTSAGSNTCSGGQRTNCHPPGSFGHYQQDAQTFAEWEVDYVKLDWCGHNLTNAQQQQTEFSQALNKTGRHMWLELCRGYAYPPPPFVAEIANSWRITGDHYDYWNVGTPAGHGTRNAIAHSANATNLSGKYNWAYNDFLMTGGQGCNGNVSDWNPNVTHAHCAGQTALEYYTSFSIWSIISTPLLIATDVRNMTDIMKNIILNEEVIAVNQNNVYPAGNIVSSMTTNCDKNVSNACQVWARQIETNSVAIVLYNAGEQGHNVTVDLSSILNMGWKGKDIEIRDLWQRKILGYWVNEYTNIIEPHGVQFVTATMQ
eukprot:6352_1